MDSAPPTSASAPSPIIPPSVTPLSGFYDFVVRGWRPFAGWVVVLILLSRGVIVPMTQLVRHEPVDPFDIVALTALLVALGFARNRSKELMAGTSA